MANNLSIDDVVNYLVDSTDEEYAEVFARYYHVMTDLDFARSEDFSMSKRAMRINIPHLCSIIHHALDEIIYSDEIDESAWWKRKETA